MSTPVRIIPHQKMLSYYSHKPERFWQMQQQKNTLRLFHAMSQGVKGYKKFLKEAGVRPGSIRTYQDLQKVPPMSKKNYFHKYELKDVVWDGLLLKQGQVMTSTSGSTGMPTYFPRTEAVDAHYALLAQYFLNNGPRGSTLLIDCFGMGVWIGGLITYQAFRMAALQGYPVTIITPGINKKEIFHSLHHLAPSFDNVILSGYPPFIKDVIDEARQERIDFKKFNTRLLFAAESFTENFREYVARRAHVRSIYYDTLNLYGSAELGATAFETPGAIFIRRLALRHADVYNELFHNQKVPTLAQYNPAFIGIEEQNNEILLTANSASPFLRYSIGDSGGVFSLKRVIEAFDHNNVDLVGEAKREGVPLLELPFVFVHERSDFSTTLYGLQIYPQTIKAALEQKRLQSYLTGKFTMNTIYDKQSNQFLEINIELKPKVKPGKHIQAVAEHHVLEMLIRHNSEFRELTRMLSVKRTKPRLVFWEYNHETYFKSGIKQQWLKR